MNELAFFENYCSYFNSQDLEALGDCFSGPLTFYLPEGNNQTFKSREEMDSNTKKIFEIYNNLGFYKADFNLLSVIQLAKSQHLCQLKWTLFNKSRKVITVFETAYVLSGEEGNFSITAVFVKDEPEKMQALQSKAASKESKATSKIAKVGSVNESK